MLASKAQRDGDACASHRATGGIVCTGVMPPLSRIMHSNGIGNKANADSVVLAKDEISSPIVTPTRRFTVNERFVRGPKIPQREAALVLSDPAVMTGHYVPLQCHNPTRCRSPTHGPVQGCSTVTLETASPAKQSRPFDENGVRFSLILALAWR